MSTGNNKPPKPKQYKHERYSDAWEAAANDLARCYAPEIEACNDCGAPVVSGYCCGYCNSDSP